MCPAGAGRRGGVVNHPIAPLTQEGLLERAERDGVVGDRRHQDLSVDLGQGDRVGKGRVEVVIGIGGGRTQLGEGLAVVSVDRGDGLKAWPKFVLAGSDALRIEGAAVEGIGAALAQRCD